MHYLKRVITIYSQDSRIHQWFIAYTTLIYSLEPEKYVQCGFTITSSVMLLPIYDFLESAILFLKGSSGKCQLLRYLELHI